ncbi:hypothetical protein SCLCIDRAFT_1188260, partial [Scleroderma citrinum Foug A]
PDSTRVVSGSYDNTVRIWDADRGVEIGSPLQGHTSFVTSVAFSPDGRRKGSSHFSSCRDLVWDKVTSVAFSPDGRRIVSGSNGNTVGVWDADKGVQIGSPCQGHTSEVTSVAFSPDGMRIVSGSYDNTVRVWDADRGVEIGSSLQGHTEGVTSVAFSPNGTRIVSGSYDNTVRVWDA